MSEEVPPLMALREHVGITQEEMAQKLLVTRQRVQQVESLGGGFRRKTAERVLELFPKECKKLSLGLLDFIA